MELEPLDYRYKFKASLWQHFYIIDPVIRYNNQRKARAYLARYGRVSPFEWDDRSITELYEYYEDISEIIKSENALTQSNET